MEDRIIQIDASEIREGKIEEVKSNFKDLVEFVEKKEPRIITYNVYFSEDEQQVTVVQVHPDTLSLENHMEVAGPEFSVFKNTLKMKSIEIYGTPSDKLLTQLQKKAEMLGSGKVSVHHLQAGVSPVIDKE